MTSHNIKHDIIMTAHQHDITILPYMTVLRAADLLIFFVGVFSESVVHTVGQTKVVASITNVSTEKVRGKL